MISIVLQEVMEQEYIEASLFLACSFPEMFWWTAKINIELCATVVFHAEHQKRDY